MSVKKAIDVLARQRRLRPPLRWPTARLKTYSEWHRGVIVAKWPCLAIITLAYPVSLRVCARLSAAPFCLALRPAE